jgi:glycosyltransferase involved in cell wall biosynthesis
MRRLEDMGAASERAVLFNWGVDLELFTPNLRDDAQLREKLGLDSGPVIFSPRAPVSLTNPTTVVDAFEQVAQALPGTQLVLKHWGSASLDHSVESARIHALGHVTREEMADYYRAADVCVSIPSSDSSPRSVWEAMACGCPCVVSDLEWVDELIEPGADALVVPIQANAVASAILRILSDQELATMLSRRGRVLVETHRDQQKEMDRLEALYAALAAHP